MQVNKYRAGTISEATAIVKNELGPDAMILSTRKLDDGSGGRAFEISAVPAQPGNFDAPYQELKNDLMSIKEMVFLLNHSAAALDRFVSNPLTLKLYARLIRNGVSETYARQFLAGSEPPGDRMSGGSTRNVQRQIIRNIMGAIRLRRPFEENGGRSICALIGTTGVGKTTTIAKIAARLMLQAHKKVGLISIDNYRIGAFEQLKTYAGILGVPCFPAFNRKDLLFALKRLEQMEVVMIDTAGQSQYDNSRIEELKRMMTDDLAIETHLLLSVATSAKEMERTAANFRPLNFESYIFTKLDEAESCGSIINQVMTCDLPVSYLTTGQNVPEDIEPARRERIVQLVLNQNLTE